ncbi:fimbrial protein [Klebsiella sp. CN_Kp098]|uniref:fimbrial protein n=1 Tax=unclassified Klebsiella TaxID=2608929 RepID=UPI0032B4707A
MLAKTVVFFLFLLFFPFKLWALECQYVSGTSNWQFNITKELDSTDNTPGATTSISATNSGGSTMAICPGFPGTGPSYRSYVADYPVAETDGDWKYIKVSRYFEVAARATDAEAGNYYPPVDYVKMGDWTLGSQFSVNESKWILKLKITKPFIGHASLPNIKLFTVFITTSPQDALTTPVYTVSFSGDVTVPQSCQINSGQVIKIDLGPIPSAKFGEAGAGNPVQGFAPKEATVTVVCSGGVSSTANLTIRLQGVPSSQVSDALKTTNPDIGVEIMSEDNKVMSPDGFSGIYPFRLDNEQWTTSIKAFPISLTGKLPAVGPYQTQAVLRVDFP